MKRMILVLVVGLILVPAGGAHTTKSAWTTYDAQQRLTIGRFAAAHGIKYAICVGTGASVAPRKYESSRRFRHLECTVQDKDLENERQLVVHVRSETSFFAEWLTVKPACG